MFFRTYLAFITFKPCMLCTVKWSLCPGNMLENNISLAVGTIKQTNKQTNKHPKRNAIFDYVLFY